MSSAAYRRGLLGGNSAEPEVMQLERKECWIPGPDESPADHLLDGTGQGCHGDRIPDLQEYSFGPVGQPIEFGIGVFDGDKGIKTLDDRALLDGSNPERESAAVLGVQRFEAFVIERLGVAPKMG